MDVAVADGAQAALDAALRDSPDAIVIRLGTMNHPEAGLEFVDALKNNESTKSVPVLVVSSRTEPQYRVIASEVGCDGYLLVPTLPDVLAAEIRRVLNDRSETAA